MRSVILSPESEASYEAFIKQDSKTFFDYSWQYRRLLEKVLEPATPVYFAVINDQGEIRGVLPCFLSEDGGCGRVLNSLPFFGSSGGVLQHSNDPKIHEQLLDAMKVFALEHACAACTIVSSPHDPFPELYETHFKADLKDDRLMQVNSLPAAGEDVESALMAQYDSVRRRNIRKAIKGGVSVRIDNGDAALDFIYATHVENMESIGGSVKPDGFYQKAAYVLQPDAEWNVFIAEIDGTPVAGLFLLYYNNTVEYFTPVVKREYRSTQALSLVVHNAMIHAAGRDYTHWSWGGTWLSQDGVYKFKEKWGAETRPYSYFTRIFESGRKLFDKTREEVLAMYPYWYVLPFSHCKASPLMGEQ